MAARKPWAASRWSRIDPQALRSSAVRRRQAKRSAALRARCAARPTAPPRPADSGVLVRPNSTIASMPRPPIGPQVDARLGPALDDVQRASRISASRTDRGHAELGRQVRRSEGSLSTGLEAVLANQWKQLGGSLVSALHGERASGPAVEIDEVLAHGDHPSPAVGDLEHAVVDLEALVDRGRGNHWGLAPSDDFQMCAAGRRLANAGRRRRPRAGRQVRRDAQVAAAAMAPMRIASAMRRRSRDRAGRRRWCPRGRSGAEVEAGAGAAFARRRSGRGSSAVLGQAGAVVGGDRAPRTRRAGSRAPGSRTGRARTR